MKRESVFPMFMALLRIQYSLEANTNALLYETLFASYNKAVRPVEYTGQPTAVSNESDETLKFSRWFQMFWHDPDLTWDPKAWNGTEELLVEAANIWIPDITIIEMLEYENAPTPMDFASLMYNGTIRYSLNDIITVYCGIDAHQFPYDEQNCSISYVSWEYPADQIMVNGLESAHQYLYFYGENSEWDLLGYLPVKPPRISDNATISFDVQRYDILFRRKPEFYLLALVLPSFLITALSIIGIFSPSSSTHERTERIQIGLTATLAMSVVLMMVTDIMPKSDKSFPVLGQYMIVQMCVTTLAVCIAVGIMYLQASSSFDYDLPDWLLKITFVNREDVKEDYSFIDSQNDNRESERRKQRRRRETRVTDSTQITTEEKKKQTDLWAIKSTHPPEPKPEEYVPGPLEPPPNFNRNNKQRTKRSNSLNEKQSKVLHEQMELASATTIKLLTQIQHVINKVDVEIKNNEADRIRIEVSMRVCYRIDIFFDIIFNLINIFVTVFYFHKA